METTIPYQEGLLLGRSVDMKSLQLGYMLISEEAAQRPVQINRTTTQFSFVQSLRDVCDVLSVPLEYALKVVAGQIQNDVVSSLLEGINLKDTFTLVFRASFLQQKQYLPPDTVPNRGRKSKQEPETPTPVGEETAATTTATEAAEPVTDASLLADAMTDLSIGEASTSSPPEHGTHWVRAVEVGNELLTIVRITGKNEEKHAKLFRILEQALGMYHGPLDSSKMANLIKAAEQVDKKLGTKNYSDIKLDIRYCSYRPLDKRPNSVAGMMRTLEAFMDQCAGWAKFNSEDLAYEGEVARMSCDVGVDAEEQTSVTSKIMNSLSGLGNSEAPGAAKFHAGVVYNPGTGVAGSPGSDGEGDSFIVIKDAEAKDFFNMRVTLQAFEGDEMASGSTSLLSSLALIQYPETTYSMFERMLMLFRNCERATEKMQRFLMTRRFAVESRVEEANKMLKSVQGSTMAIHDLIAGLDLITIPPEQDVADLLNSNPLDTVKLYIENVLSKLPPGGDVDLLVIGKTGHGKSATGNSILGLNRFEESPDEESVTEHTNVAWSDVDGRTLKVVDTPGVCDTKHDTDQSSIDVGIHSISEAIANCPAGFHALLLVIGYGTRMTLEERKAVGLLKCILGDDVIKTHTICIITFGDRFKSEKLDTSFEDWCRSRSGFLKDLFEECNYRCVLFNNKATDPRERKSQLISLVNKVDALKAHGTRYTNSLFEFALAERRRVMEEHQAPQASEEMMRDIQLVLEYLNKMVDNTDKRDEFGEELNTLRGKVDMLSSRLNEVEGAQMGTLVDTVFALAETIHVRMDEIADREPESPDAPGNGDEASVMSRDPGTLVDPSPGTMVAVPAGAGRGDSEDYSSNLRTQAGQLQICYNEVVQATSRTVTEAVTEKVQAKVKEEKQCFPGDARVCLASGNSVALQDLKVGDRVLSVSAQGKLVCDTVYMFGHYDLDAWGCFVVLNTGHRSVAVTADHYVFAVRDGSELCLTAGEVRAGDFLRVCTDQVRSSEKDGPESRPLALEEVTSVDWESKRGLFAPFTHSGSLLVDGALVSCYIAVLPARACHALLWPVRQLYRASPQALALVNGSSSLNPVPGWAKAVLKLV